MADLDDFVQCPPNSSGQRTDCSSLTVNGFTVLRQRMVISDPSDPLAKGAVINGVPASNAYAPVVRPRVEDGADVAMGATTDAAVVTDVNGTLSGKLRGLIKILADIWNTGLHALTITGSVTANAGTNLNTSLLALESGGNLALLGGAISANKVNVNIASGSSGNAAASATGAAVPANASYTGFNLAGNLTGASAANPFPVTAVLTAGAAVIGHVIADAGSTTVVTGNVAVTNAGLTNIDVALSTRLKPADTLAGVTTVGAVTAITNALPSGTNVIGHVITDSGSTTAVTGSVAVTSAGLTNLDVALSTRLKPADTLAAVTTLGTITNALPSGTNVIGHVITDSGSTTAVTGNVAVTNAGLTNIDVALSTRLKPADTLAGVTAVGSITSALPAGTNVIGHVITDAGSTTAVTGTVAVSSTQLPAALGSQTSANSFSVTPASDSTFQTIDDGALILSRLDMIGNTLSTALENTGRLRVVLDPLGGAQTLGTVTLVSTVTTVTTVSTVTTVTAVTAVNTVVAFGPSGAGVDSIQTFIHQLWQESWAASVGSRMT